MPWRQHKDSIAGGLAAAGVLTHHWQVRLQHWLVLILRAAGIMGLGALPLAPQQFNPLGCGWLGYLIMDLLPPPSREDRALGRPINSAVLMSPMLGRKSKDHTIPYLYHKQFTLLYYITNNLFYFTTFPSNSVIH